MTAVVWIVKPGDDNEQLRYSLRSVAANLPHTSAWIAGHRPRWVAPDVHHRPAEHHQGDRHGNVRRNITEACRSLDRWILAWDDVYVTRPLEQLPVLHAGPVDDIVARLRERDGGARSKYATDIEAAGRILRTMGIADPRCYDALHVPQTIHSEHMLQAIRIADHTDTNCILTLHGNLAQVGGTEHVNAKSADGWAERILVSTSQLRFDRAPEGQHIRALFPQPCQYEAT